MESSPSYMSILPSELNYEFLYFLPVDSILNMCQVNVTFAHICNDEIFWLNKLRYDYPKFFNFKPAEISWKQAYFDLVKGRTKEFPVYFKGKLLANVWIKNTNTEREVHANIFHLFNKYVPTEDRLYYIHVLLKGPGGNQYSPALNGYDTLVTANSPEYNGSLWENAIGFDILDGEIILVRPRSENGPYTYILSLPGGQYKTWQAYVNLGGNNVKV